MPARDFGGYADAEYRFTGGSHSVGASVLANTYAYRLPTGEYDYGQTDTDARLQRELEAQHVQLQPVVAGQANIHFLDGPLAGKFDIVPAENGKPPEKVDTRLGSFLDHSLWYVCANLSQVRDGKVFALYLYKP